MSYFSEVMNDVPRGYWRLSETSGLPQDISGNGNNADTTNGTPTYSQTGAILTEPLNNAIRFDIASNESFTGPDAASLHVNDVFTFEVWLKRLSTSAAREEGLLVTPFFGGGGIFMVNNQITMGSSGVGYIVSQTGTLTDTTNWHHAVVTKNGATCKVYLDGADVTGSVSNLTCGTASGFNIGEDGGGSRCDAILDECALYGTVLSQSRVVAHYQAAFSGSVGPVAYSGRKFGPF